MANRVKTKILIEKNDKTHENMVKSSKTLENTAKLIKIGFQLVFWGDVGAEPSHLHPLNTALVCGEKSC